MAEIRPTRFQILPIVIKNLLIINILVFLAQIILGQEFDIDRYFALHTWQSPLFKPWQLITHMFMHGSAEHLIFNMLALWMFGSVLEGVWGPKKFLVFYLLCGLGAALAHMLVLYYEMQPIVELFKTLPTSQQEELLYSNMYKLNTATVGASGAVFGCLAAFGFMYPESYIYVYFLVPIKAKWFVILYAAVELFMGIKNSAGDNVAHFAHLGGAVVGFLLVYFWKKSNRQKFY